MVLLHVAQLPYVGRYRDNGPTVHIQPDTVVEPATKPGFVDMFSAHLNDMQLKSENDASSAVSGSASLTTQSASFGTGLLTSVDGWHYTRESVNVAFCWKDINGKSKVYPIHRFVASSYRVVVSV